MRYFVLLCLFLAGCSKNSSGPGSTQPSGPLKKDPGVEAVLYALQTVDYVEGYVEKPSAMHKVTELDAYVNAALKKIPPSDFALEEEVSDLSMRVLELDRDRADGKDTLPDRIKSYHIVHDQLLDKIKKIAAERNASADLPSPESLEVAHPAGAKWSRTSDDAKVYYELLAKNSIVYSDSSQKDSEVRPKLEVTCSTKKNDINISVDVWVETEKVRLKFDGSAPVQEKWVATNSDIFPLHSEPLYRRLSRAKIFSIELTPHRNKPQTVSFDLADFKDTVGDDRNCK